MNEDHPRIGRRTNARLLIVDDHAIMRRGMREVLSLEPDLDLQWEADDIPSALEVLDRGDPDLALVDLTLKRGNGLQLIREMKRRRPEIKILVLSIHDERRYVELARRAGAEEFISKSQPTRRIVQTIRGLLAA